MEEKTLATLLSETLQERLGADHTVSVVRTKKNNGVMMTGIKIQKQEEIFAPVFYINGQEEEKMDPHEICQTILEKYLNQAEDMEKKLRGIDLELEHCRSRIIYRLVSRKRNKELLKKMPYIPFLDLAITFYLAIDLDHCCLQTIRIENELQEKWGLRLNELYRIARKNTEHLLPIRITRMNDLFQGVFEEVDLTNIEKTDMIIISNEIGVGGASALLYEGAVERLAEQYQLDLYIIPSSIHEVIVLPIQDESMLSFLQYLVRDINHKYVDNEEILSNCVYRYKREERKFEF